MILHPTVAAALAEARVRRFHDAAERERLAREARRRDEPPVTPPKVVIDVRDAPPDDETYREVVQARA